MRTSYFLAGTTNAVRVAKVLDYSSGPLPKQGTYVTRGGTLKIDVSGSCIPTSVAMIRVSIDLDDDSSNGMQWVSQGEVRLWGNTASQHIGLVPKTFIKTGLI